MVTVNAFNGWQDGLPSNISMKNLSGQSNIESFYHPEIEEVIHIVCKSRPTFDDRWYVLVTDTTDDLHRTKKLYRELVPGVEDEIVRIWTGLTGRCIFEASVSDPGDAEREAKEEIREYMKNNP